MDVFALVLVIIFVVVVICVATFIYGPDLLSGMADKIDEWRDVIEELRGGHE